MRTTETESADWVYQMRSTLPNGEVISFRTKPMQTGIFDEAEMQLTWQRPGQELLIYLVGSGHAGYEAVELRLRDDANGICLVTRQSSTGPWQTTASLDLVSGEYHAKSDFLFPPPQPAWAAVDEQGGVLVEKQLTWAQDSKTGMQRLFDGDHGQMWELSEDGEWIPKAGARQGVHFPLPVLPYRMQPPSWCQNP